MKIAAALLCLAACASSPTGSKCPTDNAPTYESFGQSFFTTYCTGCHSSEAGDRHGAPSSQNYDTEAQIRSHASDIDLEAAYGPNAKNSAMPDMGGPVHMGPNDTERVLLGQFLACVAQNNRDLRRRCVSSERSGRNRLAHL